MGLTASELTVLVELCNQTTRNDLNEPGPLWLPVTRAWARVDPIATREFVASSAIGDSLTVKIHLRDDVPVNGAQMVRLIDSGEWFNIEGIIPVPADCKRVLLCSSRRPPS